MIRAIKNFWHLVQAAAACLYFRFPGKKLVVIGVTGTDGKTTTTNLIYHILTTAGFKTAVLSTLSSAHTTTPEAWNLQKFLAQSVKNKCTHVVLEVSSHAIDQHRIWGIPFAVGVLTNIANNEHLDYHKTFENYQNTKINFVNSCQQAIINGTLNISPRRPSHRYVKFGLEKGRKFPYETKLLGDFNKLNILAAVEVARILGIDEETIKKAVASFEPPPGRLEIVCKKPLVIVDFAHTPQAFEKVLPTVKPKKGRLIHVFGCTGDRDKTKRPIMGEIAAKYDDVVILTTEDTYSEDPEKIIAEIESGIRNQESGRNFFKIPDRREAIKKALEIAKSGDVVFISGVGHQKSLNIGGKEVPWSDQRVVIEEINNVARSTGAKK